MTRRCEICDRDISHMRADARACSGSCRAERSRREKASASSGEAHKGAPRRSERRASRDGTGTKVYLRADELDTMIGHLPTGRPLEKALEARRRLLNPPGPASRGRT